MPALNPDCMRAICQHATYDTLRNMKAAGVVDAAVADAAMRKLQQRWNAWVQASTRPVPKKHFRKLDAQLGRLVLGDGDSVQFSTGPFGLTSVERLWVYRRAHQLGLYCDKNYAYEYPPLEVRKSAYWKMNWTPSTAPFGPSKSEWRADCEECGCALDARSAYYNGDQGPMCYNCIKYDRSLHSSDWIPKAEIWEYDA